MIGSQEQSRKFALGHALGTAIGSHAWRELPMETIVTAVGEFDAALCVDLTRAVLDIRDLPEVVSGPGVPREELI